MIFNQKSLLQRQRTLFIIVSLVILVIFSYVIRLQFNQSILMPLEERIHIESTLLQSRDEIEMADYQAILQELDLERTQSSVGTALVTEDRVVWSDFENPAQLQEFRQQLRTHDWTLISSQTVLQGYGLIAPITYQGQRYALIQFYPKEAFRDRLNRFYGWGQFFLVLFLLLLVSIYRILNHRHDVPMRDLQHGLEKLADEDYSFEYASPLDRPIDRLGHTLSDVTDRLHQRISNLRESEERLLILMNHINLGVILINEQSRIELINPAARSILNIPPMRNHRSYQGTLTSTRLIEMIDQAISMHRVISEEIEVYIPKRKYVDVNIIPYGDIQDNQETILVLLYDITKVKRLENVRSDFVANASHELRTPVTAIKGFSETLLSGALDNPEVAREFIQIIARESTRLETIIHDILELTRIEQDQELTVTSFNVRDIVEAMPKYFATKLANQDIQLNIEVVDSVELHMNQHRFEQILINLIDNAINYSNSGGQVTVRVEQDQVWLKLSVMDQGIGIPLEEQQRIFERFYRVDKARSRHSGGTGLGLSIVKNLILRMGGSIDVQSRVGEGSTFMVHLPLDVPSPEVTESTT